MLFSLDPNGSLVIVLAHIRIIFDRNGSIKSFLDHK